MEVGAVLLLIIIPRRVFLSFAFFFWVFVVGVRYRAGRMNEKPAASWDLEFDVGGLGRIFVMVVHGPCWRENENI